MCANEILIGVSVSCGLSVEDSGHQKCEGATKFSSLGKNEYRVVLRMTYTILHD